jgi:NADPH2:quinone reductase
LKEDEYLLVTGAAGGMGAAAVQLGKLLGAKVIAAASSDEKLVVAKKLGADFVVNYAKEDMKEKISQFTNGKFVDVVYEVVGGDVFDKVHIDLDNK